MRLELVESVLKRDRLLILSNLAVIVLLAWIYMGYLAVDMQASVDMQHMEMAMPELKVWGIVDFTLIFIMWSVMMIAMMIPSATPMILTYASIKRKQDTAKDPLSAVYMFVLGYLIVWTAFSAIIALVQLVLHNTALLSPMMVSANSYLSAGLLIFAGIFQWTALKHACLDHCRTPAGFFMTEWQDGINGALRMGIKHGVFCTVCCWLVMALMFVAGTMNLLWMTIITVFVLIEKVAPAGGLVGRIAGVILVAWGLAILIIG